MRRRGGWLLGGEGVEQVFLQVSVLSAIVLGQAARPRQGELRAGLPWLTEL